jgi:hypothetical protein
MKNFRTGSVLKKTGTFLLLDNEHVVSNERIHTGVEQDKQTRRGRHKYEKDVIKLVYNVLVVFSQPVGCSVSVHRVFVPFSNAAREGGRGRSSQVGAKEPATVLVFSRSNIAGDDAPG